MRQISKYKVEELGQVQTNIFSEKDAVLITGYNLQVPFFSEKHRLNLGFYDLNNFYIQTENNITSYKVLGQNLGEKITEISVDPVQDALDAGYLGDVILSYEAFNDVFSPDRNLKHFFITDISSDRTEIRTKTVEIDNEDLKNYVDSLQEEFNNAAYFPEVFLYSTEGELYCTLTNVQLDIVDGEYYILFKLYEPLPANIGLKGQFSVLQRVGSPVKFKVERYVEIVQDGVPTLREPNFTLSTATSKAETTDYLTPAQIFLLNSPKQLSIFKGDSIQIGIDYENFENFIHFSSAAERLENFRYKMQLLENYPNDTENIISNFDHYERYLYFETGDRTWPTGSDGKKVPESMLPQSWWEGIISEAEAFDNQNENILISTIPQLIREDKNNEAYLVFVHMIGQHFDNEWIYAKAVTDRYKADHRPNFGIPSDLVKEALRGFGIRLEESDQNLVELFKKASEADIRIQQEDISQDEYVKEVYKRIYHNVPFLIKSKGTHRGLKALIECFGIPESILSIKTLGGVKIGSVSGSTYIGPQDGITNYVDKVRIDTTGSFVPFTYDLDYPYLSDSGSELHESGSFFVPKILSSFVPATAEGRVGRSKDSHEVVVGFELNKQFNDLVKVSGSKVGYLDIDDIIGDPRNIEENYGESFTNIRNNFLKLLKESNVVLGEPISILWLVRYFDTVLFNLIKDFTPARDSVAIGAVVEDNVLHRNRARLGDISYSREEYSCSIQTGFITGSTGGSLDGINTNGTLNSSGEIVGGNQEPRFTGILSGSEMVVTDGELNEDNKYKKGNTLQPYYDLSFYFLDLPSPAYCSFAGTGKRATSEYILYNPTGIVGDYSTDVQFSDGAIVYYTASGKHYLNIPVESSNPNIMISETESDLYYFLGWYKTVTGSYAISDISEPIISDDRWLGSGSLEFTGSVPGYSIAPRYTDKSIHNIIFNITVPTGISLYTNSDILISWSSSADLPNNWLSEDGRLNLKLLTNTGSYVIPFNPQSTEDREGVIVFKMEDSFDWRGEHIGSWKWGVDSVGGHTYPGTDEPIRNDYLFEQTVIDESDYEGTTVLYLPGWVDSFDTWKKDIDWVVEWSTSEEEYIIRKI